MMWPPQFNKETNKGQLRLQTYGKPVESVLQAGFWDQAVA